MENSDLKIKEENGRVFVNKCSEKVTKGPKHMLTAMERGEKNRSIGETNMNERSSRSHTIFRIVSIWHLSKIKYIYVTSYNVFYGIILRQIAANNFFPNILRDC